MGEGGREGGVSERERERGGRERVRERERVKGERIVLNKTCGAVSCPTLAV